MNTEAQEKDAPARYLRLDITELLQGPYLKLLRLRGADGFGVLIMIMIYLALNKGWRVSHSDIEEGDLASALRIPDDLLKGTVKTCLELNLLQSDGQWLSCDAVTRDMTAANKASERGRIGGKKSGEMRREYARARVEQRGSLPDPPRRNGRSTPDQRTFKPRSTSAEQAFNVGSGHVEQQINKPINKNNEGAESAVEREIRGVLPPGIQLCRELPNKPQVDEAARRAELHEQAKALQEGQKMAQGQ